MAEQAPSKKEEKPREPSPEEQAHARITELEKQVKALELELRTAQGRLLNRDPALFQKLKAENKELKERKAKLEKALFALVSESFQAPRSEELKIQLEVLRLAAVDFCKKANIDPEIWKSIAY